ncbi:MAG: MFS transporter [Chloroflexi bacterium]|nr:MFS transporter [Chloroflexota bacterium]
MRPGRARRVVTAGLMLAMTVIALEVTVVTTALPTIVGEFGRLDLYPWIFSAYLLTSTVTVPLYGKLADLFGRRWVFLFGMALFLLGSVLCGLARGMGELVAYRAIQGLGAGAIMPTIFTAIADIYRLQERARIQGLFSALWGGASLIGPALGAWLTLSWSWRGVFFVGVPFGLAAAVLIWSRFEERVERRPVALDLAGSAFLTGGLTALLLALPRGEAGDVWSAESLGLLLLGVALLIAFVLAERRAEDPVLPLSLFKSRIIAVSSIGNFLSGAVLFGITSYVPLYVQGVRGEDAAGAGAVLTPMLLAWASSSVFGPRLLLRFGFRVTAIGASALVALGASVLAFLGPDSPKLLLFFGVVLMGLGFGPTIAAFVMAVQEAVPWNVRGVATSSTQLFRSLGGTIGVALLGAVLQVGLQARLTATVAEGVPTSAVLDPAVGAGLPPEVLLTLRLALGDALSPVFALTMALAVATLLVVVAFARDEAGILRRREASEPHRPPQPPSLKGRESNRAQVPPSL